MLYQMHHQFKDRTYMCSQAEINNPGEMTEFIESTKETHPLPEDAIWMMCNDESEQFVMTCGLENKDIDFKPYEIETCQEPSLTA